MIILIPSSPVRLAFTLSTLLFLRLSSFGITTFDNILNKNTSFNASGSAIFADSLPLVSAGRDTFVCEGSILGLKNTGAFIKPNGGSIKDGVWKTTGDGVFLPNAKFSASTSYQPGANDVANGKVVLILMSDSASAKSASVSASMTLYISQNSMACYGQINLSLSARCSTEIVPQHILTNRPYHYPDYTVSVFDRRGNPVPGNIVTGAYIGQCLNVKVTDKCGNSCWGYICIDGKAPPQISCPNDATLFCVQLPAGGSPDPALTGSPTVTDCTTSDALTFHDNILDGNCSAPFLKFPSSASFTAVGLDSARSTRGHTFPNYTDVVKIIVRSWQAKDNYGNQSNICYQLIFVRKIAVAIVSCPKDVEYSCNPADPNAAPASLLPAQTGYPFATVNGNTFPLNAANSNQVCNSLTVSYADKKIDLCVPNGAAYQIQRTWTIGDGCDPNPLTNLKTCLQIIKVLDKTPPVVTASFSQYYTQNGRLVKKDTSAPWTGAYISGSSPVITPGVPISVWAKSSANSCGGCVDFTFDAVDPSCTNGAISITSSDSRMALKSTAIKNAATGETILVFSGCFDNLGDYTVVFTAADNCGLALSKQTFIIHVRDNFQPTPVCIQILHVGLSTDGTARMYYQSVDEGSNDNCGIDRIAVRRLTDCNGATLTDAAFAPYVDFCCSDIPAGQATGTVKIIMRVWDYAQNYNDCTIDVIVENNTPPTCTPPTDKHIVCTDPVVRFFIADAARYDSAFGKVAFFSACGERPVEKDTVIWNDKNCVFGQIVRSWTFPARGAQSPPCRQTIFIDKVSNFTVDFPDDFSVSCYADIPNLTVLKKQLLDPASWNKGLDGSALNKGCGVLGIEIKDDTVTSIANACFQILRHINVIDWCKYNVNNSVTDFNQNCYGQPVAGDFHSNPAWQMINLLAWQNLPDRGNPRERRFRDADDLMGVGPKNASVNLSAWAYSDGIICFTQIITVRDTTAPVFKSILNKNLCDLGSLAVPGRPSCAAVFRDTLIASDQCAAGINSGSPLGFTWRIVPLTNMNTVVASGSGTFISATLNFGVAYVVKAQASDFCGNAAYMEYQVTINDCKKPSIICKNINVELGRAAAAGAVVVRASDLLASPLSDNCSIPDSLNKNLVVVKARSPIGTGGYPINGSPSVSFNCADYKLNAAHAFPVEIWTKDGAGNADFCLDTIFLQDNGKFCVPVASIAGNAQTETNVPVESVAVSVYDTAGVNKGGTSTGIDGSYLINSLVTGQTYQARALKDDNPANGVTTYDIALINKHILGVQYLNSPYKIIAGDVNKDNDLNALDALLIRKLILHIIDKFPNNTSWRFIDKSYQFINPENPFGEDFREVVNFKNLRTRDTGYFIGLKVGDVNNSAQANNSFIINQRRKTTQDSAEAPDVQVYASPDKTPIFNFLVEDVELTPGSAYSIPFVSNDLGAASYQFTLNFVPGAVTEIAPVPESDLTGMNATNFGVFAPSVTCSWNGEKKDALKIRDFQHFSLRFIALKAAKLSDVLKMGSNITPMEGYTREGDLVDIHLNFKSNRIFRQDSFFELYQNIPNPATGAVRIGFNLPRALDAALTIFDVSGKMVRSFTGKYQPGFNEITLNASDLGGGVYYYRLEANEYTATKRMVVIKN